MIVSENELTELIRLSDSSDRYVQFTFGGVCKLENVKSNEWAFEAVSKLRSAANTKEKTGASPNGSLRQPETDPASAD